MAIYDINTIQGDVNTSYGDEYIKQALANLGQRQGLKGDAIQTQSFKITDVIFDETSETDKIIPTSYIKGYYDAKNDEIIYTADNDDLSTPLFTYRLSETISDVELNNLYLLSAENVNLAPKYVECKIVKKQSANSYYFVGKGIQDNEIANIVVLEFSESGVNLIDGLYFENVEPDTGVMFRYSTSIETIYSSKLLLSDIYNTILNYDSIDDIVNFYVNNIVTVDTNPNNDSSVITEEKNDNVLTVFGYLASVLIPEIKAAYNDHVYKVNGNEYIGLKRRILYELIKYVYNEFNKIDDKTDTDISVYFDKDFYISYISNTNTDVIYISYDITFRGRGINNAKVEPTFDYKNNANMFLADILTEEDRYATYKFYVQYIDDDKYVDSIYIEQTAILPYIGKDDSLSDVWYINGEQTNVRTTGADAGNPNIMFVSYTLNESSSKDESVIDIDVLHTYTDDNVTLEKINNAFDKEAVMQTFYYDLGNTVNVANSINKNYEFNIPLPDPNKLVKNTGFENFIKNVLIFAIVDVKISSTIIDNETLHSLVSGNGPSSYITVFFHSSKNEEGKYVWTPILNPLYNSQTPVVSTSSMAPVLDLSSMTSLRQLMNYYVQVTFKPDVYYHRWVVFTSTNEVLKNTGKNINSDAKYPVFKVDTGKEYYGTASFNTLNFTPKFVLEKNVIEDNGKINDINDTSPDNASFTIDTKGTISAVTPVIKIDGENNDTDVNPPTEFIPNAKLDQNLEINDSYPMLDLREVFVNNQTLLNRLSIITTSNVAEDDRYPIYHAYIGHRYNSGNEGIASLVIGSEREVHNMQNSTTMARNDSWQYFSMFNNLIFALPTISEQDSIFNKNVTLDGTESDFTVKTKNTTFTNSSFEVNAPSIELEQALDNYLRFENGKLSIISKELLLNDEKGKTTLTGTEILNSAKNITLNGTTVSIIASDTAAITTKNGFSITNTPNLNNEQQISFNENDITVSLKNSTYNESKLKLEHGKISLPADITTSIVGGNPTANNFIKYNPDSLEISSKDLELGGNTITTTADSLDIDSETTFNKPIVINDNIKATGKTIDIGTESTKLTLTGSSTEFRTGDTTFSGNLGVHGNVTTTNLTVNGLLVTETSSVTSVLTYPDGSNWDYPYGEEYDTDRVKKMFLFGLTTIDLNYVCNGIFEIPKTNEDDEQEYYDNSDFISVAVHEIKNVQTNTRKFMNDYSYSDITLNLTAFLNAYSADSMFARHELIRPNVPGGDPELVTKISDVNILLANPTLYTIDQNSIGHFDAEDKYVQGTVNIEDRYRLKTFLLFIERFAFFANPTDDFSIKDVYVLRQAKEISMTMDNFNPDMLNHVCILDPTTTELKNQL